MLLTDESPPRGHARPYDGNGNRITKNKPGEHWAYTWDLHNRLKSVSKNGVEIASYTYDAENLRVAKTKGQAITVYAYRQDGLIAYQKDLRTLTTRTYVSMGSTTLGWTDTKADGTMARYFGITDQIGSVTQVTDATGQVVWSSEYRAFGTIAGRDGAYDFDGIYAGHEYDADTGLIYMWNRWQDPETGSFLSQDPARQGTNWYAYVGNNPLTFTDPTGMWSWGSFWSSVGVGVAATAAAFIPVIGPEISGAIVGAYLGGSVANNSFSFGQWDWSSGKTWGGIGLGAGIGAFAGFGIASLSTLAPEAQAAVEVGTAIGAYTGGKTTNGGQLNPFVWNWSSPDTWAGLGIGGVVGGSSSLLGYQISTMTEVQGFAQNFASQAATNMAGIFRWSQPTLDAVSGQIFSDVSIAAGAGISNATSSGVDNWAMGNMRVGFFQGNVVQSIGIGILNGVEGAMFAGLYNQALQCIDGATVNGWLQGIPLGKNTRGQTLTLGDVEKAVSGMAEGLGWIFDSQIKPWAPYAAYELAQPLNSSLLTNLGYLNTTLAKYLAISVGCDY